jgi:hypothetical protein
MSPSAGGNVGTPVGTLVGTPLPPYLWGLKGGFPPFPPKSRDLGADAIANQGHLHVKPVGTVGMWEPC